MINETIHGVSIVGLTEEDMILIEDGIRENTKAQGEGHAAADVSEE